MSCGTHLSVAEIAQVKCLRETTTMSMMEIAQHIGRSKTAVFNCLKREAEGRDYVKQPGRPKRSLKRRQEQLFVVQAIHL